MLRVRRPRPPRGRSLGGAGRGQLAHPRGPAETGLDNRPVTDRDLRCSRVDSPCARRREPEWYAAAGDHGCRIDIDGAVVFGYASEAGPGRGDVQGVLEHELRRDPGRSVQFGDADTDGRWVLNGECEPDAHVRFENALLYLRDNLGAAFGQLGRA